MQNAQFGVTILFCCFLNLFVLAKGPALYKISGSIIVFQPTPFTTFTLKAFCFYSIKRLLVVVVFIDHTAPSGH